MPEELQNGLQCAEFEALMTDAMDGALKGTSQLRFDAHRNSCASCAAMFTESQAGLQWLQGLPEVEPPADLVNRIVLATSGQARAQAAAQRSGRSWLESTRELVSHYFRPAYAAAMQPRFAMSFGMAFFSISMLLNISGFKMASLRHVDLRPNALVRSYYETTGKLVKYYENIRFVYEIETRVRELRKAPGSDGDRQDENNRKENKREDPGHRYQNYSWREMDHFLARGEVRNTSSIETRRLS